MVKRMSGAAHAERQPDRKQARAQDSMMSRCQRTMTRQLTKKMGKTGHLVYFEPRGNLRGRNARSTRYCTSPTGVGATLA